MSLGTGFRPAGQNDTSVYGRGSLAAQSAVDQTGAYAKQQHESRRGTARSSVGVASAIQPHHAGYLLSPRRRVTRHSPTPLAEIGDRRVLGARGSLWPSPMPDHTSLFLVA